MTAQMLAGLRVLDLTTIVVGPAATLRLADYGAEVIKIEAIEGDLYRVLGGPSPTGAHSGGYLHFNRGKRTVGLDLKRPEAREALSKIIEGCDVVVANMRLKALERLGLDAATLLARHPTLIHCTITGFGPGGPYRGAPGYDSVFQGVSGIAATFTARDGAPAYVPLVLCDHLVGEITAGAIMAALLSRHRTGKGSTIEVPMHETVAAFVLNQHLGPSTFEPPLGPPGDRRTLSPQSRPAQTADGWISLTLNTDAQMKGFLTAIGRQDIGEDPRFRTVADRFRNADQWLAVRNNHLMAHTTAEWLELFAENDVPAMPCHTLESLLEDPHLTAAGLFGNQEHPTEGPIRSMRSTVAVDGAFAEPGRPAPPVGWDTRDVLLEAGLSPAQVEALLASGAGVGRAAAANT